MKKKSKVFSFLLSFLPILLVLTLGVFAEESCSHDWYGDDDTIINNGCSYTKEEFCGKCGATRVSTFNDQYGGDHDWQYKSGYVDVTNNCMSIITYECSLCGIIKEEEGVSSHKYTDVYDYVDETTHIAHCLECGSEVSQSHVFNNGEITVAAKCLSDGVKTYSCLFCSATKTESIDAIGHRMGEWGANLNGQHARCCQNGNGCVYTEFEDHIDNTSDNVCDVCNWTLSSSGSTVPDTDETDEPVIPEEHTHSLSNWVPSLTGKGCLRYCKYTSCDYYEDQADHIDNNSDGFCDRCAYSLKESDVCLHGMLLQNCTFDADKHTGFCSLCKSWVMNEAHYYPNGQTCAQCGYIKGGIVDSAPESNLPSDDEDDEDEKKVGIKADMDLKRLLGMMLGSTLVGGLCYGAYSFFKPQPRKKRSGNRSRYKGKKYSSCRKGRRR